MPYRGREGCGVVIEEHHKTTMLATGEWIPARPGREVRSYHLWSAYAPIGLGYSWREIAQMRADARAKPELMVTFTNTILGESYEGLSQKLETDELARRAETWKRRTIPRGCLILTAGVDVQQNRFAVLICGWGRGETCWLLDYVELPADPTKPEDWEALDEFLNRPIENAAGVPMRPSHIAIDTGNWSHDVYRYVRSRQARGVIAIKGSSTGNRPIIGRASKVDVNWRGQSIRQGVQLWMVGTDTAKHTLMQRLLGDAEHSDPEQRRIHFPSDMPPELYQHLTAERFDTEVGRWIKPKSARNEAFDCLVYAYAAALRAPLRIHVMRDSEWASLEATLEPPPDLFTARPVRPPVETVNVDVSTAQAHRAPDRKEPDAADLGSSAWSSRL